MTHLTNTFYWFIFFINGLYMDYTFSISVFVASPSGMMFKLDVKKRGKLQATKIFIYYYRSKYSKTFCCVFIHLLVIIGENPHVTRVWILCCNT